MTELEKTIKLKRKLRVTGKVIESFNPQRVSIIDKTSYVEQLSRINTAVLEVVVEIEEFIDEIENDDTKKEWETEIQSITAKEEANSIAVKKRLEEICAAEENAASADYRKEKDAEDAREKARIVQKRKLVCESIQKMNHKINLVKDLVTVDDDKIRRHWRDSETWECDQKSLNTRLEEDLIN